MHDTGRERVASLLREHAPAAGMILTPLTRQAIAAQTGLSAGHCWRVLNDMVSSGEIIRLWGGYLYVVSPGQIPPSVCDALGHDLPERVMDLRERSVHR